MAGGFVFYRESDGGKTASAKGFGGKDSVKENRQGFLSRQAEVQRGRLGVIFPPDRKSVV